jgi:hypothetical protein
MSLNDEINMARYCGLNRYGLNAIIYLKVWFGFIEAASFVHISESSG